MSRGFRLASHIHSSWSDDCEWPLTKLARVLRLAGFDGALVCDHDRTMTEERRRLMVDECAEVSARGFLLVPGVEYQDSDHVVHMPIFGDLPFYGRSPQILDVLRDSYVAGGVSVFAHPSRHAADERFEPRWAPFLTGIEIWNRKYDGITTNRWALDAIGRFGLGGFVGLDFHGPRQLFPLTMNLQIDRESDARAVLQALRDGRFRPTAFGVSAQRFSIGALGEVARLADAARRDLAPRIRSIERTFRRREGSSRTSAVASKGKGHSVTGPGPFSPGEPR